MNKERGFTLIEILATIAAAVVLLGMVAMYASNYREASTANAFVADVQQLTMNLKSHYKGRQDYSGLTTKYAQDNGLVPQALALGTAWGSSVSVVATDIADEKRDGDIAMPNSGFAISWAMPIKVCSSVLPSLLPRVKWLLANNRIIQRPGAVSGTDVQSIRSACATNRLGGTGKEVAEATSGEGGKDDKDDGGGAVAIGGGGAVDPQPMPIDPGPAEKPGMVVFTLKDG